MPGLCCNLRRKFGRHLFATQMIDLDRGTCLFSKFLDLLFEFLIRGWGLIGRRQHLKLALLRLDGRRLVQ